ncbi:hypothetical protein BpHYR1_053524 [Brachionus plicatilis]|uniref:RNA-directed DNA polymerase from mobile element jockey-like n=1 Tax=Brachionus plicatilis TaxID=10195 RepID=A0A3M7P936_BRAPC|nr:hypothetical protein BpHYR1_053524 [Brachionus plicatilis]
MKHLIEFEQLTSIDTLYLQKTDHTFFNKNNKSNIDHILVNEKLTKNCKQANILNDIKHKTNTSDHLAIEFEIDFNLKLKSDCKNNNSKKKPKWNELDFRLEYEKRLCEKLNQLDTARLARINKHNSKIILTELINELTSSMICSINDIQQAEKNNKNNKHTKRKRWWNNEIQKMSDDVKNAKQRQKKASISTKWTKQINTLYYTHKDKFWEELKRRRSNGSKVDIEIETLSDHFKELFTTNNLTEPTNDEQIQEEVDNYASLTQNRIDQGRIEVKVEIIKNIIENLPNGKSCGFAEVNYEMFKYGPTDQLA